MHRNAQGEGSTQEQETPSRSAAGRRKRLAAMLLIGLLMFGLWLWWGNARIGVTRFRFQADRLPQAFSGFRIAQVSDLHNKDWGRRLPDLLAEAEPDVIFITGDLIDQRRTDVRIALDFVRAAVPIAPVYYVTGNHERWSGQYDALKTGLEELGVRILDNEAADLLREGETIRIAGITDPAFSAESGIDTEAADLVAALAQLPSEPAFSLLLAHRPEYFQAYADAGMDLIFAGHAHGGQFRLPFIGAVFAPGQGLFPRYTSGISRLDGSAMLVSRGLGNSSINFRFNNQPELVILDLIR